MTRADPSLDPPGSGVKKMLAALSLPLFLGVCRIFVEARVRIEVAQHLGAARPGRVEIAYFVEQDRPQPLLKASLGGLVGAPEHRTENFLHDIRSVLLLRQAAASEAEDEGTVQGDELVPRRLV